MGKDKLQSQTDRLRSMIETEIPRECKRIEAGAGSLEQLRFELCRTVLGLISDVAMSVHLLQRWAVELQGDHADHLDEHEDRLAVLEEALLSGETQITVEDAELFGKIIAAAETFAEQALAGTVDAAGKSKLREILDLCKEGKDRIEQGLLSDDEDDEQEEPEGEQPPAPQAEVIPTASQSQRGLG